MLMTNELFFELEILTLVFSAFLGKQNRERDEFTNQAI